jgi:hypothetical protein
MRHVTLAAATLAALAFAAAAYADSNFGPRRNGDQCWHQQSGNSRGYWSPCTSELSALAQQRTQTKARTFEQCVQLAKQRGYTSSDRDIGDPNSALRRFVANCMAGRQK